MVITSTRAVDIIIQAVSALSTVFSGALIAPAGAAAAAGAASGAAKAGALVASAAGALVVAGAF